MEGGVWRVSLGGMIDFRLTMKTSCLMESIEVSAPLLSSR